MTKYFNQNVQNFVNSNYATLTREDELIVAKLALKGNQKAKEKLINSVLKLKTKYCFAWGNFKQNCPNELFSQSFLWDDEIIAKFDPERGARFVTIYSLGLRDKLKSFCYHNDTISRPVRESKEGIYEMALMDESIGEDLTLADMLGNEDESYSVYETEITYQKISKILEKYNQKVQKIFEMYYKEEKTFAEIGKELGQSPQAVNALYIRTVEKIKPQLELLLN